MTARRGLHVQIDGSNNGVAPSDARLSQASLVADDGVSALSARVGVFYDGQGNVVSGNTDTGTMSYSVRACQFAAYLLGSSASGVVFPTNDAVFKATTTAAPGSNSRIDSIYVRQHCLAADGGTDTDNIAEIKVAQGTPAASPSPPTLPTGALELARATVPSGTTSTNGLTITQMHGWTSTHGSPIPVRNQTERDALTPFAGMEVMRLDVNNRKERYSGSAWVGEPVTLNFSGTTAASTALLTVTHGLGFTPTGVVITPTTPTTSGANASILLAVLPQSFTSTQMTVRALNATPGFMVSTAITFTATFIG